MNENIPDAELAASRIWQAARLREQRTISPTDFVTDAAPIIREAIDAALRASEAEVARLEHVRENWIAECGDATRRARAAEDRAARLEAALRRIIRRSGRGPEVVSRIAREALENANALPKEGAAPVAEARPEGYPKYSTGAQEGQG